MTKIVIHYRQCTDNELSSAPPVISRMASVESEISSSEMMLGFKMKVNTAMKMVNGNKRKKLIFAHQNLRGGDVSTNDDDNQKSVGVDQVLSNILPDVLGISETQVSDTLRSLKQGYTWEVKKDSPRISVLVNSALNYRRRKDLELDNIAAIWVELSPQASNPILVCNLYREWAILQPGSRRKVPGSKEAAEQMKRWKSFVEIWKRVVQSGQEFHVMGDFNMDRNQWRQIIVENGNQTDGDSDSGYDSEDDDEAQQQTRRRFEEQPLVDVLYSEILSDGNVVQLVKKKTWFRQKEDKLFSSTLDLYFTNAQLKISQLQTSDVAKSDHLMIAGHRRTKSKIPQPSIVRKRKWSKINWEVANCGIVASGVEGHILACEDPDECAERLHACVRVHLDIQEQVKQFQLRGKYCAWVNESAKMIMAKKEELNQIWMRTGLKEDERRYRLQSNYQVRYLRKLKKDYFAARLRSTLESKDVWKAGKSMLGWPSAGAPTSLIIDGELTADNKKMAQSTNDFFSEKPKKIAETIPTTDKDPLDYTKDYLKDKFVPQFGMPEVTPSEVVRIIEKLKNSEACGHDDISTNALKCLKYSLAPSLAHIINLSFRTGKYPKIWKLAKIIPLYKNSGEKTDQTKYRPIALLPVFSKVIEKVMAKALNRHLENNSLYSDKQHGYRRKRSTATALIQLQEDILKKFEENKSSALLCFDSSAAFDTVTHSILLDKLKLYGADEEVINWFSSYLADRFQYCELGGKRSTITKILQGVFQGSVLGPLLYILYINCIVVLEDDLCQLYLYADDTNARITLTGNNDANQAKIQQKAAEMQTYMDAHHLKFNCDKTQILIKKKGVNNTHKDLNLTMNGTVVNQSESVKVLGIVIGQDEKYEEYLVTGEKSMLKFLNKRLNMLKILSKHADFGSRKALAEGLILSKIDYCVSLWGITTNGIIDRIQKVQNKTVRVVFGKRDYRAVTLVQLYRRLKWLKVKDTKKYHDTISLESVLRYKTPRSIANLFNINHTHRHNTRHSQNRFRLTAETTSHNTTRSNGYVCRAARCWAELSNEITMTNPPRYIFKDYVRSAIGGWDWKDETSEFIWWNRENETFPKH